MKITKITIGDTARVKKGRVGEGYTFVVTDLSICGLGRPIACGANYGYRWISDLEVVK